MAKNRFRWIIDEVPEWWKALSNVQVDIPTTIALLPNGVTAAPGDWIIQEPDGHLRSEINREGRIEAKKYLDNLKREVANG